MSDVITAQDGTFLTKKELAARWRVKERSIEMWVAAGKIPKPMKIGDRKNLWSLNDIIDHEVRVKAMCNPA